EQGDLEPYRKADVVFHTRIMETSSNAILENSLKSTQVLSIAFSKGLVRSPRETHGEHNDILDALERQDAQLAEQLMTAHVRGAIPKLAAMQQPTKNDTTTREGLIDYGTDEAEHCRRVIPRQRAIDVRGN